MGRCDAPHVTTAAAAAKAELRARIRAVRAGRSAADCAIAAQRIRDVLPVAARVVGRLGRRGVRRPGW